MDFLRDMRVLQDQIGDLARQNNEQALDLIQLRSKVSALGESGSGSGGGIDVGGIVKGFVAESKSSNSFSTTQHVITPTMSGTSFFMPDTLYLVMLSADINFALSTGTAADIMVYGTIGIQPESMPSGMELTMDPRNYYHPQFRVVQPSAAGQTAQMVHTYVYQPTFIYGYKNANGSIKLQLTAAFHAVKWGTTTAYTGSGWKWGNIEYVAIPIGILEA